MDCKRIFTKSCNCAAQENCDHFKYQLQNLNFRNFPHQRPVYQILVDRVRAGVVSSWLPRRLGGGLGHRQRGTQRFTYKVRLEDLVIFLFSLYVLLS